MNDIFKRARRDQEELPREIMAHKLAAEYHRHWDMVLGGVSTVLTTLVSTAIFTALVKQLGLNGEDDIRHSFGASQCLEWVYWVVLILAVSAPVLSALHTFMHNAEDAATHRASAEGYSNVLRRLTVFLAKYDESNPALELADALKDYDEIMQEYNSVLGKSLTLTERAYISADETFRKNKHKA